ncbi:GDP-mannose 4,6-dehydratase, partial [Halomonas sp. SIMBA_159]
VLLQQVVAEDYGMATGLRCSLRQLFSWAAAELGIHLEFSGHGTEEVATVAAIEGDQALALKPGDVIMRIDPRYFRPAEVETLLGDPTKAKENLGWVPEITVQEMCAEMI